jgi:hypothetical protein
MEVCLQVPRRPAGLPVAPARAKMSRHKRAVMTHRSILLLVASTITLIGGATSALKPTRVADVTRQIYVSAFSFSLRLPMLMSAPPMPTRTQFSSFAIVLPIFSTQPRKNSSVSRLSFLSLASSYASP